MKSSAGKVKPVSYRIKDITRCKICRHEFQREQLHSGGGRLIAGSLTPELRRLYEPNRKYGKVYPQAYSIMTCPQCLYSSFQNDFEQLTEKEIDSLKQSVTDRKTGIEKIFGPLNFNEDRNLVLGAASYILAIDCYQHRGINIAPTPKKAICSIRAAWLLNDLHEEFHELGFEKIRDYMYEKAVEYYTPTLEIMSNGREPHEQFQHLLGPDTDNNWGFDGVVYIYGYLTQKYLHKLTSDPVKQKELLEQSKRYLGKLYGLGKASKGKPSMIIDMSKDLYEEISEKIEQMAD